MSPLQSINLTVAMFSSHQLSKNMTAKMIASLALIFKEAKVNDVVLPIKWKIASIKDSSKIDPHQYNIVIYQDLLRATKMSDPKLIQKEFENLQKGLRKSGQAVFLLLGNASNLAKLKEKNPELTNPDCLSPHEQCRVIPVVYELDGKGNIKNVVDGHEDGFEQVKKAIDRMARIKKKRFEAKQKIAQEKLESEQKSEETKHEDKLDKKALDPVVDLVLQIDQEAEKTVEVAKIEDGFIESENSVEKKEKTKIEVTEIEVEKNDIEKIKDPKERTSVLAVPITPVKKSTRLFNFTSSIFMSVITAIAMRLLWPKMKSWGVVGLGGVAGSISFLTTDYFRNRRNHAVNIV